MIDISNIRTSSNNITLRKVNTKPYGPDKMHMNKLLMEDKLYHIIDQFNKRKVTSAESYSLILNKIHQFYDGNGRKCKILLGNMI